MRYPLAARSVTLPAASLFLLATLPGCRIITGIFKAGMWTAFVLIGIVALLGFGLASLFRKG